MVHIIMATYNGEKYIEEQINSILEQTYTEWRLYINDDGSTDKTKNIIKQYVRDNPDKILSLNSEVKFRSAKKNFAYLFSSVPSADYYAFCDQDDIWYRDKLAIMVDYMSIYDCNTMLVAFHDMKVGISGKKIIAQSFFEYSGLKLDKEHPIQQILLYNTVPGCAMIFNHKVKEMIEAIPEECIMHDWWILLVTICLNGKIFFCKDKLSIYRQHSNNQIGAVQKKSVLQTFMLCFNVVRLRYYIKNNQRLRNERLDQTMYVLKNYGEYMENETVYLLEQLLMILNCKRKLFSYKQAKKSGFIFFNNIYTLKFYLL
ncbi:MAG: glycosyltransferase family 2 protein [Clostridiales bacterium]|nr:glycosyltransferase family 2 protein [Clostridiales bacterium]